MKRHMTGGRVPKKKHGNEKGARNEDFSGVGK